MISKLFFTLFASFSFTTLFGQEEIWTKQMKISEVLAFEKRINPKAEFLSKNASLSKDYYPLGDKHQVTNPLIVKREPLKYLPMYAEYFYTPSDSILRFVSYDWEKGSFDNLYDKQKLWKEERKKFNIYNSEYERIKSFLLTQLGTPISTDTTARIESSDRGKYFKRDTLWETEDVHAELNMIFESITYRVRFTIYWKK